MKEFRRSGIAEIERALGKKVRPGTVAKAWVRMPSEPYWVCTHETDGTLRS